MRPPWLRGYYLLKVCLRQRKPSHFGAYCANALMLKSMVTGERVPAPGGVFEMYRDSLEGYAEAGLELAGSARSSLTAGT